MQSKGERAQDLEVLTIGVRMSHAQGQAAVRYLFLLSLAALVCGSAILITALLTGQAAATIDFLIVAAKSATAP